MFFVIPVVSVVTVMSVVTVVSVFTMVGLVTLVIFVMVFVLLFGMLFFFFSMLFILVALPIVVTLPPVWMVLVCRLWLMVIPPILVVPLVVAFVERTVAILPGGWLLQRLPILLMSVRPSLEVRML